MSKKKDSKKPTSYKTATQIKDIIPPNIKEPPR